MVTLIAPELERISQQGRARFELLPEDVDRLVRELLTQPLTPQAVFDFENALQDRLREAGRECLEVVLNAVEPDEADQMPKQIEANGYEFSRKNQKTPNRRCVGTLFGEIVLWRYSYEPLSEARDDGEKSFSPLERALGIVAGNATPALAERVGREASQRTQQELLDWLRREHAVSFSPDVLRKVTAVVSEGVAQFLHDAQKARLLAWLAEADQSRGRRCITFSVGRDGIMLPIRGEKTYKEGAVATVTVYDRRGRRLGTVYLGQMPEAYQQALSDQLTRLLTEVLGAWDGRWPRLVYVTDAGFHPTQYFDEALSHLEHPRHPGRLLEWTRIVDFYHACEYLTKLSQALFDDPRAGHAWSRRMRTWLKHDDNAVFRILHSAAKYRSERKLTAKEAELYDKAYQYQNNHKAFMDYREYRRRHLPIGSGVTEAACKTVFTQRFKESGMSWGLEGGAVILTLRLAKLSGVWETAYARFLATSVFIQRLTKPASTTHTYAKAA